MSIAKTIEKILTEPGLSILLRERILLLKEQIMLLERQNADLKVNISDLSIDNLTMKTDSDILSIKYLSVQEENAALNLKIDQINNSNNPKDYDYKWGCITFHDDSSTLHCPNCFLTDDKKIPVSRNKGGKSHFCPVCKTDIPS